MSSPLDNDKIEALLRKPEKKRNPRGKATDFTQAESRTYQVWFTLSHKLDKCGNPDCADDRPLRTEAGNAMVVPILDTTMCRLCFLDGFMVEDG